MMQYDKYKIAELRRKDEVFGLRECLYWCKFGFLGVLGEIVKRK